MNETVLQNLGFTRGEIKTFLALIEINRAPVAQLAKQTELNRTALYDILDGLIRKGVVSYVYENKKKYYHAAPPERLEEYYTEQEKQLHKQKPALDKLIAELKTRVPKNSEQLHVEVFRGTKGVKTIMEDVFKTCSAGDEVLAFGFGGSNYLKILGSYFHTWIKKRIKLQIKFRGIFNEDEEQEDYVSELGTLPYTQAIFPFKKYEVPTRTKIYGDKVAIILLEKQPTAILITDPRIATGYRYFFEFLWRNQ